MRDLIYQVEKSERKTLSIYVEKNGRVLVKAPRDVPQKTLEKIIKLKQYWIYKSIAELQELNRTGVSREIANGEGFLFMGKSYRLRIEEGLNRPLRLSQGYFMLDLRQVENARRHFIEFYRQRGKEYIVDRVNRIKERLGVNPKVIRVMDLRNRWASRTEKGLNFHWKVMLAPMTVIDYIIVHELAHYVKPGHGADFWKLVESVMPNYE